MSKLQVEKKSMMVANQKTIAGLLEQMKGEIARCLPSHITPDRMTRIALTELRKTPKLQECDPMSFIACIMLASQLGLEPGVMGASYLVPYFNKAAGKYECTFIPGYRGFLQLARRSGQISSLIARAVYSNDIFSYKFGLREDLIHEPAMKNRGELIAFYAVALMKDGGHQFEVMSKEDIDVIRNASPSKNSGPWVTHYEEMAKKTVLRRLFKWLPCSTEMQKAVSLDELQDVGKQNIKAAASEEFDFDFAIDAETGEVIENEQKKTVESDLQGFIDKNKASQQVHNTGLDTEPATPAQVQEILALMKEQGFDDTRMEKAYSHFSIEHPQELTQAQAIAFLIKLGKK